MVDTQAEQFIRRRVGGEWSLGRGKPAQGSRIEIWNLGEWMPGVFCRADGRGFLFWPDQCRPKYYLPNAHGISWRILDTPH